MPTDHGDELKAREVNLQTNNTDIVPHKTIGTNWNQSATTRVRKKVDDKKKMQAVW